MAGNAHRSIAASLSFFHGPVFVTIPTPSPTPSPERIPPETSVPAPAANAMIVKIKFLSDDAINLRRGS